MEPEVVRRPPNPSWDILALFIRQLFSLEPEAAAHLHETCLGNRRARSNVTNDSDIALDYLNGRNSKRPRGYLEATRNNDDSVRLARHQDGHYGVCLPYATCTGPAQWTNLFR